VTVFGGGGEKAIEHPELFKQGHLHLWPLYRMDKQGDEVRAL